MPAPRRGVRVKRLCSAPGIGRLAREDGAGRSRSLPPPARYGGPCPAFDGAAE